VRVVLLGNTYRNAKRAILFQKQETCSYYRKNSEDSIAGSDGSQIAQEPLFVLTTLLRKKHLLYDTGYQVSVHTHRL
jgi:hypothetical protein